VKEIRLKIVHIIMTSNSIMFTLSSMKIKMVQELLVSDNYTCLHITFNPETISFTYPHQEREVDYKQLTHIPR
jgi:hypothetical protein